MEEVNNKLLKKNILAFTIPVVFEQLFVSIMNIVSPLILSNLGDNEISAVGPINTLINLIIALFTAFSIGTNVVIARSYGNKDRKYIDNLLCQLLLSGFITVVVICGFIICNTNFVVDIYLGEASQQVKEYANQYLVLYTLALPLFFTSILINSYWRGTGNARTPFYVSATFNIINVILTIVLALGVDFYFIQIPAMGVLGLGISMLLSRSLTGITSMLILFFGKNKIEVKKEYFKPIGGDIKRVLRISFPSMIEQAVINGSTILFQFFIYKLDVESTTAYQITMAIYSVIVFVNTGFSLSSTTLVGQKIGEKKYEDVSEIVRYTFKCIIGYSLIIAMAFLVFPEVLASLYTDTEGVIKLTSSTLRILGVILPFASLQGVLVGVLRGIGDVKYVMWTDILLSWCIKVPCTYILIEQFNLGIYGVFLCLGTDFVLRFISFYTRYKRLDLTKVKV